MISTIFNIIFLVIIAVFMIVSLLAVFIYIRHGRTPAITLTSSAVFIVLLIIGFISAYASLQTLINLYA